MAFVHTGIEAGDNEGSCFGVGLQAKLFQQRGGEFGAELKRRVDVLVNRIVAQGNSQRGQFLRAGAGSVIKESNEICQVSCAWGGIKHGCNQFNDIGTFDCCCHCGFQ